MIKITTLFIFCVMTTAQVPSDTAHVRIGLALSGGAALGLAHIGVIKVLEQEGIPISYITGNSMGSMVGGVHAAGYTAAQIESIAVNADWSHLFSSRVPYGAQYLPERQQNERYIIQLQHNNFSPSLPSGLVPLQNVEFLLMELLSEIEYNTYYDFDSLPIPYRAIAVDLDSGQKIDIDTGRLEQAIRASIAIPGVFAPEVMNGSNLVDGGVQQYLPVYPLYPFEPDFIIAVLTMKKNESSSGSLIDVVARSTNIVSYEDLLVQKELAHILIEPDVDPFLASDFARVKELIAAGETAARAALPEIRALLGDRPLASYQRPVSPRVLPMVRTIMFDGVIKTNTAMLHRIITTKPGMQLDFHRLIEDLRALYYTGLFSDVNYRVQPASADSIDITIEIKEHEYGSYALGILYTNSDNMLLGIEARQDNLWGSGASMRMALHLGNPREIRLGLAWTHLFTLPFGFRLDACYGSIERAYYENGEWQADYTNRYAGGITQIGYMLGNNAFFTFGAEAWKYFNKYPALALFDTLPQQEWIVTPTMRMEFNDYNNLAFPTHGSSYRLQAHYSSPGLQAPQEYLRIELTSQQYSTLSENSIFLSGLDIGTAFGHAPWSLYYRSGGETFVGFSKDEFTTQHKILARLGFDIRLFDLFGQSENPCYIQLQIHGGYFDRFDRLAGEDDLLAVLHWGAGTGVRANTPIGPVRMFFGFGDFGKPSEYGDVRFNYIITIGREFRYTE
ncbi:MAG: patatin-like phospholipase family protein [candidate division WOR-3 bacterium]|nr:MAG: patatin-like phospholipase family protein [candidate division WOR-3 bacterium]